MKIDINDIEKMRKAIKEFYDEYIISDMEKLKQYIYPKDIFPEISNKEWGKINKLLIKELGFSLDRVSANLNRKMWRNMSEWFIERIKSACEFYLKYKDKPELLIKGYPEFREKIEKWIDENEAGDYEKEYEEVFERRLTINIRNRKYVFFFDKYNEWLFKLAFKGLIKNGK